MLTGGLWRERRWGGWGGESWVFGCKFNWWGSVITQLQFEPHARTHMTRQNVGHPRQKGLRVLKGMKPFQELKKKKTTKKKEKKSSHLHPHRQRKEWECFSCVLFLYCLSPTIRLRTITPSLDSGMFVPLRGRQVARDTASACSHSRWYSSATYIEITSNGWHMRIRAHLYLFFRSIWPHIVPLWGKTHKLRE